MKNEYEIEIYEIEIYFPRISLLSKNFNLLVFSMHINVYFTLYNY